MRLILTVVATLALAGLAGCVERNVDESGSADRTAQCTTPFVTIHYEGVPDNSTSDLQQAFERAGWTWRTEGLGDTGAESPTSDGAAIQGVARVEPANSAGVEGIVSYQPGASSDESLLLSFEANSASVGADVVHGTAQEGSRIVNQTFEDARVNQWIAAAHTAGCDPLGGPQTGVR